MKPTRLVTQRCNSVGHLLNYGLTTATSALQLRAQAKQCLIKHDFEQAEQLLSQGLKLTPGSYKLYRLRSVAYACLQRYRESLEVSDLNHVLQMTAWPVTCMQCTS